MALDLQRKLQDLLAAGHTGETITSTVREALPLVNGVPTIGNVTPSVSSASESSGDSE